MNEGDLRKLTLLSLPRTSRMFRNNTGMAWQGTQLQAPPGRVILKDARPVHYGLVVGGSDLIGWNSITITPDMVGKKVAVFTAVELKAGRTSTSKDQINFIQQVRDAGGIAGIARTPEEAKSLLESYL